MQRDEMIRRGYRRGPRYRDEDERWREAQRTGEYGRSRFDPEEDWRAGRGEARHEIRGERMGPREEHGRFYREAGERRFMEDEYGARTGDRRYGGYPYGYDEDRDDPRDRGREEGSTVGMGRGRGEARSWDRDMRSRGAEYAEPGFGRYIRSDDVRVGGEGFGEQMRRSSDGRGKGPKNYVRSDDRIREDVCELLKESDVDASEIEVKVRNCEVTLEGTVANRWSKREAEDVVCMARGVRDCHNQLRIESSPGSMRPGNGRAGASAHTGAR